MTNKTENTYYICYAWCEHEERMVDFFGSHSRKECEEECQCLSLGTRHKIVRIDDHADTPTGVALGKAIAESKGKKPKPVNGAEVLAWQQFKMHEGDKHLYYILAKFNGEYAVWSYNEQDGGCYYGRYFWNRVCGLENALKEFEAKAEPHRNFKQLTEQEKFEMGCVSLNDMPENYSHPSYLSLPLGEYEKEVK